MHSTAKRIGKRTLKKNDSERNKFQSEAKYKEYLKKERERKQRGMYLGFEIVVVRVTET